jgi:hypothetical protein
MGLQAPAPELPLKRAAPPALSHAPLIHAPSRDSHHSGLGLAGVRAASRWPTRGATLTSCANATG